MRALVALLGFILSLPLMAADKKPLTKKESAKVIEAAIRKAAKRPTGELSKEDYGKVTKLDLSNNQLRNLTTLENLSQLEELSVSVNGLDKLTELTTLVLMGNQLIDVRGLGKLTKLTILILNGNRLTQLPKGLANLKQLEYLDLRLNEITDVSDLKKLSKLTELQLSNNPSLTKAQIDKLQKALPICKIKHNAKK